MVGGSINAIINGVAYWSKVKGEASILLTEDAISSTTQTVFSGAVPTMTSLAFIGSCISYFTLKNKAKPPFFPKAFLRAMKNSVFAFGVITIFALLLQRFAGSISVSPIQATLLTAVISGMVSMTVDYLTKTELVS